MPALALAEMVGVAIVVVWTVPASLCSEMALLAVTDYRHNKPEEAGTMRARRHPFQSVPRRQLSVESPGALVAGRMARALDDVPRMADLFALDRLLTSAT